MVEAMQDKAKHTQDLSSEGSLFPDLAPYGKVRPPVLIKTSDEPTPPPPLPPRQPNITARPLRISAHTPKKTARQTQFEPKIVDDQDLDTYVVPAKTPAPTIVQKDQVIEATTQGVKKRNVKSLLIIAAVIVGLMASGYLLLRIKNHSTNVAQTPPSTSTKPAATQPSVTIPLYIPTNLPKGYTYNNDKKTMSPNVFSMSVTGPHKEYFYITQQTPPVNNDYTPFNKQLTDPRNYDAAIGKVTTGSTKNSFIVSINTVKNTWVIINSPNTGAENIIKPVIDSLSL